MQSAKAIRTNSSDTPNPPGRNMGPPIREGRLNSEEAGPPRLENDEDDQEEERAQERNQQVQQRRKEPAGGWPRGPGRCG